MTTASLETDRQTTRAVGMATTAAATTMRAIVQRRYGSEPEEVLHPETVAIPGFGDHEVLIRVRAAGVDRGTWHLMAGTPHLMRFIGFGVRGPRHSIPGLDVAGTVEAVGSNVTDLTPGQHVVVPDVHAQGSSDGAQHFVSGRMAEVVIVLLEVIDIQQDNREG